MDYRHQADVEDQDAVLARLHAEIAAQSPEHAALVGRHETVMALRAREASRVPPGARGGEAGRMGRLDRIAEYARHRDAGLDRGAAAARVGVGAHTAGKYETIYRRGQAG